MYRVIILVLEYLIIPSFCLPITRTVLSKQRPTERTIYPWWVWGNQENNRFAEFIYTVPNSSQDIPYISADRGGRNTQASPDSWLCCYGLAGWACCRGYDCSITGMQKPREKTPIITRCSVNGSAELHSLHNFLYVAIRETGRNGFFLA